MAGFLAYGSASSSIGLGSRTHFVVAGVARGDLCEQKGKLSDSSSAIAIDQCGRFRRCLLGDIKEALTWCAAAGMASASTLAKVREADIMRYLSACHVEQIE